MSQGTNQKHMMGGGVLLIFADINLRPFPVKVVKNPRAIYGKVWRILDPLPSTQKQMCLICFVMLFKMELSAYPIS